MSSAEHDNRPITVGFVGNPNCGKTTLFNAFTGAKLKVATGRASPWSAWRGRPATREGPSRS